MNWPGVKGGGVPDSDWNEPLHEVPHVDDAELHKFRSAILKEVTATLEKEIGTFRTALKGEMEDNMNKRVEEVCFILVSMCLVYTCS